MKIMNNDAESFVLYALHATRNGAQLSPGDARHLSRIFERANSAEIARAVASYFDQVSPAQQEKPNRRMGERRQVVSDDAPFLFGAHSRRLPTRDRRAGNRMRDMLFGDTLPF